MGKPDALRLADALTQPTYPDWVMHIPAPWHPPAQETREAAAELRRLHAENECIRSALNGWIKANNPGGWIDDLRTQRDALLEALKALDVLFSPCVRDSTQAD